MRPRCHGELFCPCVLQYEGPRVPPNLAQTEYRCASTAIEFFTELRNGSSQRFANVLHKDEMHVGFDVLG
jgi:hypothetical protein